ncbi:hypothetical protein [Pedobacter frigidisoli]|uniref:hypothetical protein n=1 Tax=Pedobacter frigidisoli TaxID=2530455 RepID=UPI00292F4135|nr:hypothetical protein [Pedobacter frigidisoli]
MEKEDLIPSQQVGQQTDAEEEKIFDSPAAASLAYKQAVLRLKNVNQWHTISRIEASCFVLFDKNGIQVARNAKESDYIRIDIPGPGTSAGKGYDWVCIEHMEEFSGPESDVEFTLIVARPSKTPGVVSAKIAHFFTNQATSTFMVFRRGNVLSAEVHGRNEVPNTENQAFLDKTRNLVVNGGSAIGMSYIQWHLLASGILK